MPDAVGSLIAPSAWTVQPSPNVPGQHNELSGVWGTSSTNVFAVGDSFDPKTDNAYTLVMHCC